MFYQGMTVGFRAAVEFEVERQRAAEMLGAELLRNQQKDKRVKAWFDKRIRRIKVLKKVAATELKDAAAIKLVSTSGVSIIL